MSESLQNFFMYVGIFTAGVFSFLLFCTMAFFSLLLEDQWRECRKSRYAKHQKAEIAPKQEVIENFFPMEPAEIREERLSQEALQVLRDKLTRNDETVVAFAGWETENSDAGNATVSYPAFNTKGPTSESRGAHKA